MAYAIVTTKPGGTDVLHQVDIDPPVPSATDVLIRQTAVGVNFIDVYFRTGLYPWPVEKDLIVGSEGAGTVEAVGPQASAFSIGDRVAYTVPTGAYATHFLVPAASLVHLPDHIDDTQAAAIMLKGLTACYPLHDSYPSISGSSGALSRCCRRCRISGWPMAEVKRGTRYRHCRGPRKM